MNRCFCLFVSFLCFSPPSYAALRDSSGEINLGAKAHSSREINLGAKAHSSGELKLGAEAHSFGELKFPSSQTLLARNVVANNAYFALASQTALRFRAVPSQASGGVYHSSPTF